MKTPGSLTPKSLTPGPMGPGVRLFLLPALLFSLIVGAQTAAPLWLHRLPAAQQAPLLAVVGDSTLGPRGRAIVGVARGELAAHWTGDPVMLQLDAAADTVPGAFTVEKSAQGSVRILAATPEGLLYGAYFILRSQTMGDQCLCATVGSENSVAQQPAAAVRAVRLADSPAELSRRGLLVPLARCLAATGINTIVLPRHEGRLTALADSLRPYALRLLPADSLAPVAVAPAVSLLAATCLDRWHSYRDARRTWQPDVGAEQLAFEWLALTFTENPLFILPTRQQLLDADADAAALEQSLQQAAARYRPAAP